MSRPTRSELVDALRTVLDGGSKAYAQKVLDRHDADAKRCPSWVTSWVRCALPRGHPHLCEMP